MSLPRPSLVALASLVVACGGASQEDAVSAHAARGDRALAEGRPAEAVVAYARARELAPTDADLQRRAMRARVHLVARDPDAMRDVAIELRYEAGLLADDGDALARVALGHLELRAGDRVRARAHYEAALRDAPDSPVARTALGLLLLDAHDTRAAGKAELERALTIDAAYAPALVALASAAAAESQHARAVELLERRLAQGESPRVRAALGHAFFLQRRFDEAIASLRMATRIDPGNADAQHTLGLALLSADRPGEAVGPLRRAVDATPGSATMLPLAHALASAGNPDAALAVYERLLELEPDAPLALAGAARAAEAALRSEVARAVWRRLAELPAPRAGPTDELARLQAEARTRLSRLETAGRAPGPEPAP